MISQNAIEAGAKAAVEHRLQFTEDGQTSCACGVILGDEDDAHEAHQTEAVLVAASTEIPCPGTHGLAYPCLACDNARVLRVLLPGEK